MRTVPQSNRPSKIAKCIFLQEGDKNTFHLYGKKLLFYAKQSHLLIFIYQLDSFSVKTCAAYGLSGVWRFG